MRKMNLLVVLAESEICELVCVLLKKKYGDNVQITWVGSYLNAEELIRMNQYDIMLLSSRINGSVAMAYLKDYILASECTKIVILSHGKGRILGEYYGAAGAFGYIEIRHIAICLETVLDMVMVNRMCLLFVDDMGRRCFVVPRKSYANKLTSREISVVVFLLANQTTSQIALKMGVHVTTVNTYKNRIFDKLGTSDKDEIKEVMDLLFANSR